MWEEGVPDDASEFAWVAALGTFHSVTQREPAWIGAEVDFLRRAVDADVHNRDRPLALRPRGLRRRPSPRSPVSPRDHAADRRRMDPYDAARLAELGIDPETIRAQANLQAPAATERGFGLFDAWRAWASRTDAPA